MENLFCAHKLWSTIYFGLSLFGWCLCWHWTQRCFFVSPPRLSPLPLLPPSKFRRCTLSLYHFPKCSVVLLRMTRTRLSFISTTASCHKFWKFPAQMEATVCVVLSHPKRCLEKNIISAAVDFYRLQIKYASYYTVYIKVNGFMWLVGFIAAKRKPNYGFPHWKSPKIDLYRDMKLGAHRFGWSVALTLTF